ncbi:MAG: hypothetical protein KGH94_01860 [Candidatus Micrarchaeota archaeon]|nr:hypothetical protein [Candidatus Micrarchaeota archaeon]
MVPIAAVLIIAAYEGRRWVAAISAAAVAAAGLALTGGVGPVVALLSVNYYFAFLMVADPKTSPNRLAGQLAYGAGTAALMILLVLLRLPYPLLTSILVANIAYAGARFWGLGSSGKP